MGTSRSAAQLGKKIDRVAKELRDQKGALNKTGLAGKRIFLVAGAGVVGRKPAGKRKIINARYDLTRDGRGVVIGYTGPAHLVMNPTRPHRIEPRRPRGGSRRRRRGQQALTIGGNVRAWANHPGTKGKPAFKNARATAVRVLPGVYQKAQITEPLRKAFR
jgi:hypothetical protein